MAKGCEGELVLIEPANKPPFLGICFYRDYEAGVSNNNMVLASGDARRNNKAPRPFFHLQFELFTDYCNIRILCSDPLDAYFYRDIKYNSYALLPWLRRHQLKTRFNFGHLYKLPDEASPRLAKTTIGNKPSIIGIDKLSLWIDFGVNLPGYEHAAKSENV